MVGTVYSAAIMAIGDPIMRVKIIFRPLQQFVSSRTTYNISDVYLDNLMHLRILC